MFKRKKQITGNDRDTGNDTRNETTLAIWCLGLFAFTLGVLLLISSATANTSGNGRNDGFGERQWAGWCEGRDDLGWSFYCPKRNAARPRKPPD